MAKKKSANKQLKRTETATVKKGNTGEVFGVIFVIITIIIMLNICFTERPTKEIPKAHQANVLHPVQNEEGVYTNQNTYTENNIVYDKLTSEPITGILKFHEYHQLYEISYQNGVKHGTQKQFHDNGNLSVEAFNKNGKLDGLVKMYYDNGNIRSEYSFLNGEDHGVQKTYNKNGGLQSEIFKEHGKLEGLSTFYYKNGKVKFQIPYKNDKTHGTSYSYYENGNLESKTEYVNGKRESVEEQYYRSGNLRAQIVNKNDQRNGVTKLYDEHGNFIAEVYFQNGRAIDGYIYNDYGYPVRMSPAHLHNLFNKEDKTQLQEILNKLSQ